MFKFALNRNLGGKTIPASVTTLSVSWLNNEFKAAAVHRGVVTGTWERPGETDGPGDFEVFLREAVERTGYHGQNVSLVLAHLRMVQQLVEVPPAKGSMLKKLIQRQAQQQKMFAGEAAWASQASPAGQGPRRVVLHLFPRLLLKQIIEGCSRNSLHLTSLIPPSAVLHHQLSQLPPEPGETALLAAETGGSTTIVVGRGDGQILLARTLPGTWSEGAERLALDLNRTILFVNQQFGVGLQQGVWLFGPSAEKQCQNLQRQIQLPVKVSPVAWNPLYWATEAPKLAPGLIPNFITPDLQAAPQRLVFAKVVAAITVLGVAVFLAASACFAVQARQEAANLKNLTGRVAPLQAKANELQALDRELSHQQQVIRLVQEERPAPSPAWLLAYLGQAVPADLVVTNLQIRRENDFWRVKLDGTLQHGVRQPVPPPPTNSLALLKSRLSGSPFHLKLVEPDEKARNTPPASPSQDGAAGSFVPGWLNSAASALTGKPAPSKTAQIDHFQIEGEMR